MREFRLYGSVRGARGDTRPYRDRAIGELGVWVGVRFYAQSKMSFCEIAESAIVGALSRGR
jgi:hypothetical protein